MSCEGVPGDAAAAVARGEGNHGDPASTVQEVRHRCGGGGEGFFGLVAGCRAGCSCLLPVFVDNEGWTRLNGGQRVINSASGCIFLRDKSTPLNHKQAWDPEASFWQTLLHLISWHNFKLLKMDIECPVVEISLYTFTSLDYFHFKPSCLILLLHYISQITFITSNVCIPTHKQNVVPKEKGCFTATCC